MKVWHGLVVLLLFLVGFIWLASIVFSKAYDQLRNDFGNKSESGWEIGTQAVNDTIFETWSIRDNDTSRGYFKCKFEDMNMAMSAVLQGYYYYCLNDVAREEYHKNIQLSEPLAITREQIEIIRIYNKCH